MAQTTVSIAATGKHFHTPPTANKLAGTPKQGGAAVPPPPGQVRGTGTQQAWKSRLPVPVKKIPGGGIASKGTAVKGATATGLSDFPTLPLSISGGISKIPTPTRKTPGGMTRLPFLSLKTPKDATGTPRKPAGTTKAPPAPCQVPRKGVASPAGNNVSQSGNKFSQSGNRVSQLNTKAKSPTPTNVIKTANDTAGKLAGRHISTLPKPKPSFSLRRPSHSPTKVRGTAGAAAAPPRQNRQPPPLPVPATVITPVTTPLAPAVVPITLVVPPRVFVPLPSTYPEVKICEGRSFNPLPTDLQKAAGAIYLERRRHKLAPKPGTPWQAWLGPKLIVGPGEYCNKKRLPGPSPLKKCLLEEEVVTRGIIIRVNGKVVAPHLGPGGRPRTLKDPNKCPLVIGLHSHRKWLMEKGRSPWWYYLRGLQDGQQ